MAKTQAAIKAVFENGRVITECSGEAKELYDQSRYGTLLPDNRVQLSLLETMYLVDKEKIQLIDGRNKELNAKNLLKKASRLEKNFWVRYKVFSDIRSRGYIIKTALKFGADFRIYERGVKPGEDHAKWIVYPVHETNALTWQEFAAKNRVAHSTKKKLMIGVVDDEGDVSYWEVRWIRP